MANPIEERAQEMAKVVTINAGNWDSQKEAELASVLVVSWQNWVEQALKPLAESTRPCSKCGAKLYFIRTRTGGLIPYTTFGYTHFIDCPFAMEFKKGGTV